MACSRKRTNPYDDCDDHEQDEDRDEYGSSSNSSGFLHDNYPPSYNADHQIQTSSSNNNNSIIYDNNGNGNTDGAESPNYAAADSAHHQDLSNGTNHQNQVQQELGGSVVGIRLNLNITDHTLISELELRLNKKDQQQVLLSDQPPAELPPVMKLKASNLPALFLRIGSWKWEAENPLDLAAKFYYRKRKLVWEFLFRPLKKKIEIQWSNISAINAYVDDQDKTGRLEIQLREPPEYYNEPMTKRLKHTQWETTTDFTQGQANTCRRHTVIFSPGALDEHLENLLQLDNRLFNLSRQPFPFHDHQFFNINTIINNNSNTMAFPYPHLIPLSIYHPGAIDKQNLVPPATTAPFVGHSNLPVPLSINNNDHHPGAIDIQNLVQPAETTSFVDNSNSPVPLSINNNDHHRGTIDDHNLVQPETTSFVDNSSFLVLPGVTPVPNLDENAREFSHMIRENTNGVGEEETGGNNQIQDIPADLPPLPASQQDALNDDQIFEGLESIIPDDQLHLPPLEDLLAEANVAQQNYSKLDHHNNSIPVMDYDMAFIDVDNGFSFTGLQFNDELAFQHELDNDLNNWLSSQYNYNINVDNDDRLPLQSFSFGGASSAGN